MGSRIKESPERTFELFIEASCPKSDIDPAVLRQFPEDYNDQESLQSLPKFCFPFDLERVWESSMVQQFTFVLTDIDGNQRFGFCRLTGGSKTCLCILSFLPWFEVFYKLLNNIADCLAKGQESEVKELLNVLYTHPPPHPDSPLNLEFAQLLGVTTGRFLKDHKMDPSNGIPSLSYFIAPDTNSLPTIPESRNLTEYVVAVDVNSMLHLYASMLHERRIIITCSKLSTLTACVHGSAAMLYPMFWQHIFIPVLPPHLLDYCCAPMPFLIGIHYSLMERARSKNLEDVVILNVDTNTLESPFNDLEKVPPDVVSVLKMKLKKHSAVTGDVVARAFLRAQAAIFGTYQDALKFNSDEPVTFCEETFLNHKSTLMKNFLQHAVHLQLFKQFIDSRLEKLNQGKGLTDIFEEEVNLGGFSSGCSKSHQLWMQHFKKGGGALIQSVRSKTNPAVKNMYKYAKGQAKLGFKGMKNRLKHKGLGEDGGVHRGGSLRYEPVGGSSHQRRMQSECLQNRLPITQHFGQSRPRRPARRYTNPDAALPTETVRSTAGELGPDSSLDTIDDEFLDGNLLQDEDMDLLGEIFDTLSTQTAHDKGLLYGTRSLDFYNLDSTEDIHRIKDINPSEEDLNCKSRRESEPVRHRSWGFSGSAECVKSLSASLDESSGLSSVSNSQADLGDSGSLSSSSHEENITASGAEILKHNTPNNSNAKDLGSMDGASANSPSEKGTGIHWDKGSFLAQPNGILAENGDTQLEVSEKWDGVLNETLEINELKPNSESKNDEGEEVDHSSSGTCTESRLDQSSNTEKSPPPTAPKTSAVGLREQDLNGNKGLNSSDIKEGSSSGQEEGSEEQSLRTDNTLPAPAPEEATAPSVQSAFSYFKARSGEQKAETVKGKVQQSPPSTAGALGICSKTDWREEHSQERALSEPPTPTNGRSVRESPEGEDQKPESATQSDGDPDLTTPRKVSELKKRFES
ncbi:DENN domain-containing protein 1B-like isoform X1 [Scyliorhinus canicula]|uniref:DENN domain-containing protein 1B-like isoform X1 n=1 Tax=Scyliorhinus canicula TaxID=7830 RepID=UPI0018F75ABB|nr:DENN domain-containing protein 1B-like isoform X1 [Scyliorhinus canicula]